jgi:hypothetical protein
VDTDLALRHPLRVALLDLVRELGTVTSTEAAKRLGESSGACSFHLRQLARCGYLEEVAGAGRRRPWRLRPGPAGGSEVSDSALGPLARELEDEGYRTWLARRDQAPEQWRRDEAFSGVLHLTPAELSEVADKIRAAIAPYRDRRVPPSDVAPVAFIARVFPLLPPGGE